MLVWVMVLFGGVEAVIGQMIEPFVYGRSMGLSAVAVVVAAVFWTWLWGPVGLLLSTPLTMCFVVLGPPCREPEIPGRDAGRPARRCASRKASICACWRKIPTTPPRTPRNSCAATFLSAYYDEVAARALMLAQADVNRGVLDPLRQARIRDAIKGADRQSLRTARTACSHAGDCRPRWQQGKPVLCVAGRGPLDEAAALLLVDMLDKYGIGGRVVSVGPDLGRHRSTSWM